MKKWLAILLSLALSLGVGTTALCEGYTEGTYTATTQGMMGPVTLDVTFTADVIAAVTVTEQSETESIAGPALERIPQDVVTYQSLGVDTVSGATITSAAILAAVADAVTQAGGDAEALKAVPVAKEAAEAIEKTADVVVIGAGGAGLAAAVQARDSGAQSVVLLEKLASIGGTTFTSQGVIGGYETNIAKKLDVHVTYEEMYDNLMGNASYRLDPALTKITVEKSGETIDWLQDRIQMPFADEIRVGYGPYQMMHVIEGAGAGMHEPFMNALEAANVDLMLETRASEILLNADGSVKGVKAVKDGADVTILCKSVVIATGGYAYNPELTVLLDPEKEGTMGIGFPGATGDGIIMASNVGAALTHTNHMMCVLKDYEIMAEHGGNSNTANVSRFIAVPNLVLVGQDAKRFVDEKSGGYMTQELNVPVFDQMHKDGAGYVWAISDAATLEANGVKRGLDMAFITADTPEALAELMGLDPAALAQTIKSYNGYAEAGFDPEFKRTEMTALAAPYCAVAVMPCEIITYGGVARNERAEVIRADGTSIPGLYVAGEASANSAYMGFTLSNCFTWGRIAGENAAAFAK